MIDNHTYRGKRVEVSVRGYPGIYRIWIWNEERQRYVDPRSFPGLRQQPFRAKRRVKALGKWVQVSGCFDSIEEAKAWRDAGSVEIGRPRVAVYTFGQLVSDWRSGQKRPPV
ncbi:MAG TPA: hypothetical protein VI895_14665 [Bdellovibrionota bacterium]|nr:hypothetical protein [Bdellovibrionota bacterium]